MAATDRTHADESSVPEVSFVLPCLDEAETLADCIQAAQRCIEQNQLAAEIVVADNGSTDGSQAIARSAGARVVEVAARGYGNALRAGFLAARGRYLVMGDSDLSYDFAAAMPFVLELRGGAELVMGSRFGLRGSRERGKILPGAMPWKHRWLGNPLLSCVGRLLFHAPVSDFHCGLRALTKEAFLAMETRTQGMEFASELVIKASLKSMRIAEVPITLHPDGRSRAPHLRSFRDGWRHLRYMLCLSPRWTVLVPGLVLMALGALIEFLTATRTLYVGTVGFDISTLLAGSLLLIVGYQWVTAGIAARIFGVTAEIGPPSPRLQRAFRYFTLELGLGLGALLCLAGLGCIGWLLWLWRALDFGPLDPQTSIRPMIVGATCVALGAQTVLMSFLYSMFGLQQDGSLLDRQVPDK